jgi:hypothetical protein
MDNDFIKSVDDGDVKSVRLDLTNELLLDPRGETFQEMLTYAKEKMHNLFEENKEANYNVPPKEEWNESFLFKVKNDLDSNFSIEKLAFYQAVIEEVGKDKAKVLDKEEEEHMNHSKAQSQVQPSNKIIVKPVPATIATGGAVLTIVGVCLGKTLLSILGGAVLIGGVLLIINDNKR